MNSNATLSGLPNINGLMVRRIKHCPCPPLSLPASVSCRWSRRTGAHRMISRPSSSVVETSLTATAEEVSSTSVGRRRRLILLRHAKSSWDDPSIRDHDRPLSKSGQADAAKLSLKLQQLGWLPQLILCSDAMRTRETLEIMQQQVAAFSEAEVYYISSFYSIAAMDGQTAEHLQQAICRYSRDDVFTVMCMGHNRGWEEAASMLTGSSIELKTCNAALLEAPGKSWEEAFASAALGGWELQGIVKPK